MSLKAGRARAALYLGRLPIRVRHPTVHANESVELVILQADVAAAEQHPEVGLRYHARLVLVQRPKSPGDACESGLDSGPQMLSRVLRRDVRSRAGSRHWVDPPLRYVRPVLLSRNPPYRCATEVRRPCGGLVAILDADHTRLISAAGVLEDPQLNRLPCKLPFYYTIPHSRRH